MSFGYLFITPTPSRTIGTGRQPFHLITHDRGYHYFKFESKQFRLVNDDGQTYRLNRQGKELVEQLLREFRTVHFAYVQLLRNEGEAQFSEGLDLSGARPLNLSDDPPVSTRQLYKPTFGGTE